MDAGTAAHLVSRFGSPLYVYDADAVRAAYREFRGAFAYPRTELHYAIVCNKNPYLVRVLHQAGAGVHANTPGDAFAALSAGVPASHVVYSGTNLSAPDLDFLLSRGIRLNLDSLDQARALLARGDAADFGLRLLVDDVARPNRIGVTAEEVGEAVSLARERGRRVVGLHMYAGTNTLSVERFLTGFERLLAAAERAPDLEYLDIGGGFGVPYREAQAPLDLRRLGAEVSDRLRAIGRGLTLVVEPGRTLVARAGRLLMTVVSVKERGGRRYVGVDSTVGNIAVESVYHPFHRVEAVAPRGEALPVPTDVCGNTTHTRDYLGRNLALPPLAPGDLLALRDVGAYGYAMSSHFLNRPRPAEVVMDGGAVVLTTRRETFEDLLATQVAR